MTAQNDDVNTIQDNEEGLAEQPEASVEEAQSDDPVETLESELQAAQIEATEARQDMLRMQADMDNLRKRLIREHEKTRLRTLERFMGDLLPVRDSLERGLEAASDPAATVEALTEGKQLIMKMLNKAMGDHGLKTIDPAGETFDPEKHEALTMMTSDQHDENTVIDVIEKGYQLHDRLIRPAKVVVSRKP
ncbi:MAG: nucleotide exchange factor GrpE [Xanthomonadales bacterium]|nr:nucleotide exchange factor GrpE [Xanthomonadales bacterium]MDH4020862.1 nucleotide exchange factor GrpE [Xanthomonadales bacterium]